ncbi:MULTISPECIES: hypothetical protein [unclassified Streptomyces]|nr:MULTISPECIES: hypothetical protein [unclassified Streptomyces]
MCRNRVRIFSGLVVPTEIARSKSQFFISAKNLSRTLAREATSRARP